MMSFATFMGDAETDTEQKPKACMRVVFASRSYCDDDDDNNDDLLSLH